jgi:hypothetical protein
MRWCHAHLMPNDVPPFRATCTQTGCCAREHQVSLRLAYNAQLGGKKKMKKNIDLCVLRHLHHTTPRHRARIIHSCSLHVNRTWVCA